MLGEDCSEIRREMEAEENMGNSQEYNYRKKEKKRIIQQCRHEQYKTYK